MASLFLLQRMTLLPRSHLTLLAQSLPIRTFWHPSWPDTLCQRLSTLRASAGRNMQLSTHLRWQPLSCTSWHPMERLWVRGRRSRRPQVSLWSKRRILWQLMGSFTLSTLLSKSLCCLINVCQIFLKPQNNKCINCFLKRVWSGTIFSNCRPYSAKNFIAFWWV